MSDGETKGEMSLAAATDILETSPDERDAESVSTAEVERALLTVVRRGGREAKDLSGATLPDLDLSHQVLRGVDTAPLDLSGATVGAIDLTNATVRVPVILDDADVGTVTLDDTTFEHDTTANGATIDGFVAHETTFRGNAEFEAATLTDRFDCREATFEDNVYFDGATFEASAAFSAASFYGASNRLGDNTRFREATFRGEADFRQADFEFTRFDDATFEAEAIFEEATFEGDAAFTGTVFEARADFDETRCDGDISFDDVTFGAQADFRGVAYRGGARNLEDDATFEGSNFEGEADFEKSVFRYTNFDAATFASLAHFQECVWNDDAHFRNTSFEGTADFDEARFGGDADFTGSEFGVDCVFRGAEFQGRDNHLDTAATFVDVSFAGDADFDNAVFEAATFTDVVFDGLLDFRKAVFENDFAFEMIPRTNEAYVNFTEASLRTGRIVQPADNWVRYDLTRASIGAVELDAERSADRQELLDYFRFCETEFDAYDEYDFDFSDHTDYLDRNRYVLHEFDSSWADHDPAVPMVPAVVERTYLKAKTAASGVGNRQAAGEFRVKRQQFARRKYWDIVGDATEDAGTRLRNAARALENLFLGITCGHGLRLSRIAVVFALFPVLPALLYTYGGLLPGLSPELFATTGVIEERTVATAGEILSDTGIRAFYANLSFSYITFLTIGYGNASPQGGIANLLAAGSVYVSVILSGLVLYALIKRSEV